MGKNRNWTRREFLQFGSGALLMGFTAHSTPVPYARKQTNTPPNVVFIICDQMRGDALSCLGHPNVSTPNLDRLAARGVLFKNYFSNGPVCVPSRVTLFTGKHPFQHGTLTNRSGEFIHSLEDSLIGYFQKRGYRTGWVGKNHTYVDEALGQLDYWKDRGREPFRRYNEFVPPFWHSDSLWPSDQCYATLNTADAVNFIDQSHSGEPFFLHVSYFDPHPPYMAPSEYTSEHCSSEMVLPPYIPPDQLSERLVEHQKALHYDTIKKTDLTETMRYYYAAIEFGVDFQVGQIIQALKQKNLEKNTIVLFTSDHGDFMGEHHMVRKAMFLYDALLHVPLIWYAPGQIGKKLRIQNLAQGVDIFPTLVDLTGGSPSLDLPGRSLRSLLLEGSQREEDFTVFASAAYSDLPSDYFQHPELAYQPESDVPFHTRIERLTWKAEERTAMARTQNWKFILNESRPPELYHMDKGWVEQKNLSDRSNHRDIRRKLESRITSQWKW